MNRCTVPAFAALFLAAPAAQAGVTFSVTDGALLIQEDAASDDVDLDGVQALGGLRPRISLGAAETLGGIRNIKVKLGAGDDELRVHGLSIGGDLKV